MPHTQLNKLGGQLPLPIAAGDVVPHILMPAFDLLPNRMNTAESCVLLLAIAGQESNLAHRFQVVAGKPGAKGPARGLWQFERGGATTGVLRHAETAILARTVCEARGVPATPASVWAYFEHDDVLAACFARMLLWTDPKPLPKVGDAGSAWTYYLRTWRPSKPHAERWTRHYEAAMRAVLA